MTKLTKNQTREFKTSWEENGSTMTLVAEVRHDDRCGNGHNTFSITGNLYDSRQRREGGLAACGCLHDEIAKHIPELEPFIKWHLTSTDGPMHYVDNTVYHAKKIDKDQGQHFVYIGNKQLGIRPKLLGIFDNDELEQIKKRYPPTDISTKPYDNPMAKDADLDAARRSAIWPDATLEQLQDREALKARLPALLDDFRRDVESLGFTY